MDQMHRVFHDLLDKFVVVFLDDILIFSKTPKHEAHLRQVLQRLRDYKFYCKLSKCELWRQEVTFLGHVVNRNGIQVEESKVKAVSEWPQPKDASEVRSFLGLASFYRRFVPRFAHLAAPLTDLLRKDIRYEWGPPQEQAFQALKTAPSTTPVLQPYDPRLPCVVDFDASNLAIGAVLQQEFSTGLHPVAYESRRLNRAERNYSARDREQLAMVHSTKVWRHYLLGKPVIMRTNHKPLLQPLHLEHMKGRHHRWEEQLQLFDIHLEYKAGKSHTVPDAFSRRPDHEDPIESDSGCQDSTSITFPREVAVTTSIQPAAAELSRLRDGYNQDPFYRLILDRLRVQDPQYQDYRLFQDLLYHGDQLYVPNVPLLRTSRL